MNILIDHGSSNNLGDAAMLEGAVSHLVSISPDAKLYVFDRHLELIENLWKKPNILKCGYPKVEVPGRYLLDNFHFFWRLGDKWNRLIYYWFLFYLKKYFFGSVTFLKKEPYFITALSKFCTQFDALFITGGGNLNDTFLGAFFEKFCLISVFLKQGKPVILTGQQIGPFPSLISRDAAKQILKRVDFLGLRDPGDSLDFCKNTQLQQDRYCVMGDDSFGLADTNKERADKILQSLGLITGEFIAFNVRFSSYTREFSTHMNKIADLVKRLADYYKMPILLVPIALNRTDNDIVSGQILIDAMKSGEIKILEYDSPDPTATREIIGNAFAAIGLSYHFCTFALTKGVPSVCIYDGAYYEHKAIGLYKFWRGGILTCSLQKSSVEQIFDEIKSFLDKNLPKEETLLCARNKKNYWEYIFDKKIGEKFIN